MIGGKASAVRDLDGTLMDVLRVLDRGLSSDGPGEGLSDVVLRVADNLERALDRQTQAIERLVLALTSEPAGLAQVRKLLGDGGPVSRQADPRRRPPADVCGTREGDT